MLAGAAFNWWTDVIVPLSASLIGGAFAILGGLWGAKRAVKYQGEQAGRIARRVRRDEREEEALLHLDAVLAGMEAEATNLIRGAGPTDSQFASDWVSHLNTYLSAFNREYEAMRHRIHDVRARLALAAFIPEEMTNRIQQAQERRRQTNDPSEAVKITRGLHRETQELRKAIFDAMARMS